MKPSIRLLAALAVLVTATPVLAQNMAPFHWLDSSTVSITTGNVSANVALLKLPTADFQIRVYTSCATPVFIRKGQDATVTATATDLPIAPASVEVLTLRNLPAAPVTYLAMISPTGSCTVYFTTGAGY
jgi:hypothetical protein